MQELSEYRRALLERFTAVVQDLRAASRQPAKAQRQPRRQLSLEAADMSIHEVIAHLRDMERHAYSPRIERILAEEQPLLPAFDAEDWRRQHYRPGERLESILEEYAALRESELERLQSMPPDGWSRQGRHPAYGLRTLQWWVEKSLAHSEEHLSALQKTSEDPLQTGML